jgi:eukaryotic-like serine/threonine-protein kinase
MVVNDPTPPARVIAGRYRLGSRLGTGLEAAVFDAFDQLVQRAVVLKMVHPDLGDDPAVQRTFRTVMASAAGLHHPNVAAVLDFGTATWNDREVLYVVTEHFTGGSLRDLLDRGRLLSPSQALVVGLDACKALDAMHRHGLLHTDIRPSTLVFGDDRRLHVIDVGLAQVLHDVAGDVTGRNMDRVKYASPEEAQGLPMQPRSDVYSLCLTLLEAVTGSVPFEGDSTVATLANRVDKLLPVSADLGALAAVFERAGRPDAADRSTAAEFGRALVQAAELMPRPTPVPILTNSLFGASRESAEAATGPIPRTAAHELVPDDVAVVPAPVADVAEPDEAEPKFVELDEAEPELVELDETDLDETDLDDSDLDEVDLDEVDLDEVDLDEVDLDDSDLAETEVDEVESVVPEPDGNEPDGNEPDDYDPDDEFPERPPAASGSRRWFLAALLVLAIGGGVLAWYNAQPATSAVPALAGLRQGEALNLLGPFEPMILEEASEDVPAGAVIRTEPAAGTTLEHDKTVTLFVSTGPSPRALPELVGMTVADAASALSAVGLVMVEGDPVFDETVPVGVVISWTVPAAPTLAAGATVVKGTTVQIIASAGPAPRTVPDLTGLTLADATAAIVALDLVVAQAPDEFSEVIPAGQVVRQDPAPASALQIGATVTVVVSKGRDLVVLPALAGLDYNAIVALLQSTGFTIGTTTGDPQRVLVGLIVNGAAATEGQQFPRGTKVDLLFEATPPTTLPVP